MWFKVKHENREWLGINNTFLDVASLGITCYPFHMHRVQARYRRHNQHHCLLVTVPLTLIATERGPIPAVIRSGIISPGPWPLAPATILLRT